jgi:hypothetical protein
MRILGWIFLPFVMIFKNWQQRSVWGNIIGSLFAVSMLSFYVLLLFVTLNGGMFVSSIPSDLRGMPNKTYSGPTYTARPTVATITRTAPPIPATATPIPATATPIPPTATTQSQASLNKTAAAKLVNSAAKTAAAKLLP